ncbi:hypothetical protein XF_a0030 (plasmid) [Xylella fastidiosa 9a5c]|uniref:Uncharacterized protein n=1 Tax=Xylella fastidiosa (strain 9a5c) TaxID=160492 RepID=Q9PHH5_XYLFA|nr:hypothetical protein XF_a0030 [Xylella fastidiosa 9a5c]
MSNSQDRDGIAINAVVGHITAISEVNQPFHVLLNVPDGFRSEDHPWHTDAGNSFSVPQLESHFSTSSAVTCRSVARNSSHAFSVSCRNASRFSSRSTYCTITSRMHRPDAAHVLSAHHQA